MEKKLRKMDIVGNELQSLQIVGNVIKFGNELEKFEHIQILLLFSYYLFL